MEDLELKEHKEFLMLEENILKSLGMWTEMVKLWLLNKQSWNLYNFFFNTKKMHFYITYVMT